MCSWSSLALAKGENIYDVKVSSGMAMNDYYNSVKGSYVVVLGEVNIFECKLVEMML